MRMLPTSKKKLQKVVIGDASGSLLCFGIKRDQVEQAFKTVATGKEVSRIELGGVGEERDKIFWASGGTICGMTKKGKEYLKLNTNVTETIRSMYVGDDDIHTGGEYIYTQFVQCKDTHFFMASDRINDLTCEHVTGQARAEAVLACQDRMVRVIGGSDLVFEAAMDGPVTTIERYDNRPAEGQPGAAVGFGRMGQPAPASHATNDGSCKELVYGTENGAPSPHSMRTACA